MKGNVAPRPMVNSSDEHSKAQFDIFDLESMTHDPALYTQNNSSCKYTRHTSSCMDIDCA